MNFGELLDVTDAADFTKDPRPGWSGPALLLGARQIDLLGVPSSVEFIAAGVPFDGTASSRPGAAEGPNAIRRASTVFSGYVDSLGEHEMCDMRTGAVFQYRRGELADAGDLHVFPTDTIRTFRAVAAEVRALAASGATLLLMGGDHSISFPAFAGWQRAMQGTVSADRLGYIQIDHHFDWGNHSAIHGPLYHGSNARRIGELVGMAPQRMAFVGVGSVTRKKQLDDLRRDGYQIVPAREIREQGAHEALAAVIASFAERCDAVYVSIDIDVLDSSVAPGTGNVTIGGISGGELFDIMSQLESLPTKALDIAEVAPRYDLSGRTAQIAAKVFFEFVYRRAVNAATPTSF
jgi:arginase family enzyme